MSAQPIISDMDKYLSLLTRFPSPFDIFINNINAVSIDESSLFTSEQITFYTDIYRIDFLTLLKNGRNNETYLFISNTDYINNYLINFFFFILLNLFI